LIHKSKRSSETDFELDSSFLTEKYDFKSSEIRFKSRDFEALGAYSISNKTISFLPLQPDESAHLCALPSSVRYKILKADRNGIIIKTGGVELLDSFYPVYRQNIQRLGSFGLPKRFFYHLLTIAAERSAVFIACQETKILGASILISLDNHAENPWFASSPEGNKKYATYAMHYAMQKMTITKGIPLYSFGSSTKDSGVEYYKRQWGTCEKTLYFNSSHPINNIGRIHSLLRPILKHIPYQLTMLLDNRVSFRVY
jgi:lipid II:glycine glycyltransferase (peptidoglycan interpeptide bridge formation enzyme)